MEHLKLDYAQKMRIEAGKITEKFVEIA